MKNLWRALQYFRPDRFRLVLVFLLMLASIGLNILKPWPLALIIDSVLSGEPMPGWIDRVTSDWNASAVLALLGASLFLLYLAHGGLSAIQNFVAIKIGLRGLTKIRNDVFARLQRLSLRYHQKSTSGDLIYRASWDTYAFQTLFQQGLITFSIAFLSLVFMVVVMAQLNVVLTLAAVSLVPLVLLVIKLLGGRMNRRTALAQQADSRVTSRVQQSIASMQLIQSYTREEFEKEQFGVEVSGSEKRRVAQHGMELFYWFALAVLFGAGAAIITWLGAKEVMAERLSVGELLVFLAYLTQLYEPLNQLSQVGASVSSALAGTNRIFEILDSQEEVKECAHPTKNEIKGDFAFVNVSFGYSADREILRNLSFDVKQGECLAIVGPSGAGKTTLLNLLPRFFDPTGGVIHLGGTDLREYSLSHLRENMALVLQQPVILSATIAENIAYGKPSASQEQIEEAARLANASAFIEQLPQKFQTVVGEGAARLSIGEQQRINLARAFLKDAPILLLDEPTSALDAESEALVVESLERLIRGRTTLIVAHRFRLIQRATRVLVIESGRMVECGTHEELSISSSYYNRVLRELKIGRNETGSSPTQP